LSEQFSAIHSSLTKIKSHYSHHIDDQLKTCSHVWLRNDFVRGPPQPEYSGPYKVVQRIDKIFTINVKDSLKTVSIDRLKVAHLPNELNDTSNFLLLFRPLASQKFRLEGAQNGKIL